MINVSYPAKVKVKETININIYLVADDLLIYSTEAKFEARIGEILISSILLIEGKGSFTFTPQEAGNIIINAVTNVESIGKTIFSTFGISIGFGSYLSLSISLILLLY